MSDKIEQVLGADLVCDYGTGHAMTHSTAVQPKIYWYLNGFHVSGLESPLAQRCNRCLIQHLMTRALKYVDRSYGSIGTKIAQEKTSPRPMLFPCSERIFWSWRVQRAMLSLRSIRSLCISAYC
jgi:hypothetical protein